MILWDEFGTTKEKMKKKERERREKQSRRLPPTPSQRDNEERKRKVFGLLRVKEKEARRNKLCVLYLSFSLSLPFFLPMNESHFFLAGHFLSFPPKLTTPLPNSFFFFSFLSLSLRKARPQNASLLLS